MREFVFHFDIPDEGRADALATQLEDRLWGDGVRFERRTMRLTVRGDVEGDALRIARAALRAVTKGTDLYAEPLLD